MLRYFIFIEYGLLPDLRVGVLISASQSRRAAQLKSLGFECFACDEAADTACYIKQTDISDALIEFDESVSDINIMNFI